MEGIKNLEYYLKDFSLRENSDDKIVSLMEPYFLSKKRTYEQIDELKKYPDATEVWISKLTQETFEYFIENYGQQFKVIHFISCPLISDFTKLEQLTNIEYLIFFWNQRATHLWNLSKNHCLKGISFDDFTRMHTLVEIPLAPALEELYFGNAVWNTYILSSLKPLSQAINLKTLVFSAKKIDDNDITPLAEIRNLEKLEFTTNLFCTEQVAWLTAKKNSIKSSVLAPYKKIEDSIEYNGKNLDILVIGKRKPFLDSKKDRKRLEKYEREFIDLVNNYREKE